MGAQLFANGGGVPTQGQLGALCGGAIAFPWAGAEGEFLADAQDSCGDFFAVVIRGVTVFGVPLIVLPGEAREFFANEREESFCGRGHQE